MVEPATLVHLTLHGFPDLGLGGSNRPTLELTLPTSGLTGRAVLVALLERFGGPLEAILGRARQTDCSPKSIHLFANDKAIGDIDEALAARIGHDGRLDLLLILVRPVAGG
jgi:hypothetical protein